MSDYVPIKSGGRLGSVLLRFHFHNGYIMAYVLDTDNDLRCLVLITLSMPLKIVSNRATNFVGAKRELRKIEDGLDYAQIQDQTTSKGVKWSFQSSFRARKKQYVQCPVYTDVNDEELMTAVVGQEALLNSRPLKY